MRLPSWFYSMRLLPRTLCLALAASQCHVDVAGSSFKHVCYLNAPKNSSTALPFDRIDVRLCSHIIMGFATVYPDSSINLDPLGGLKALNAFVALRQRRPDIKLMFSVGGGGGDWHFRDMVSNAASRHRFIAFARRLLDAAFLDGLDLDWEFPLLSDAMHFTLLLEEISQELKKHGKRPLLLSVAVPAPSLLVIGHYCVRCMARFVDFVNLMTYDLNTYNWYKPWVNHNSPLFARAADPPYFDTLNVKSSAQLWVTTGMPKDKIMVGIPTYGLGWVLRNPDFWEVGSLATGRAKESGGFVDYPQVCGELREGAIQEYDAEAKVPFMHKGTLWISYDDQKSVALKASWILKNGYGGTVTFSLNSDDWAGTCGNKSFPLQRTIAKYGSSELEEQIWGVFHEAQVQQDCSGSGMTVAVTI